MNIKRLLACILLLVMVLSTSAVFAQDDSIGDGRDQGYNDGYIFVLQTFSSGSDIPVGPSIPTSGTVYSKYSTYLKAKTEAYKANFYRGYIEGYMEGYNEGRAILTAATGDGQAVDIQVKYVDSLGQSLGEMYAYRDFYINANSNWSKAIPTNAKIISMFDLNKETALYRSSFLTAFREKFKLSYEEAYEFALLNVKDTILSSAVTDGKEIGNILGSINGGKDYFDGKSNSYKRNLPTDTTITNDYLLNKRSDEYKIGFINGFKLGYEEGYNEAFYNSYKEAVDSGRVAGELKGELMASKDYMENKNMSWKRHKSLESAVSNEYKLVYLSNVYRGSFLNAFWTGFAEKYEATFKTLVGTQVSEKITSGIIPIAGGTLVSGDNSILLEVQSGTFYNDVNLSIEKIFSSKYPVSSTRYIKASDIYNIQISNSTKNLNNSNQITIAMEYYGKYDGGIYKWVNNKWNYIPSVIEGGAITANINPNTLRTGDNLYCILIDNNYKVLTDNRDHWAKTEIDALIRRNIITGYTDGTFKPDKNISRAEFLALLSRMYDWKLPSQTNNIKGFKDYESFGSMDKVISYGLKAGYIQGYDDITFRANQPISYKEIEIIMARVLNDPSFKWYNTSANMLYNKQIKSKSYNNMNNKITRAEVAYMLYILNEWRY